MAQEKNLQNRVMNYLKSLKDAGVSISYGKREALGFSYKDGIPDVFFDTPSHHCEIELKAPGGKPSAIQLKWELLCKRKGVPYLRSSDYKKIVEFINNNL